MNCQSETLTGPRTFCPVGTDAREGDAGLCVSRSSAPTAPPRKPTCCMEEPSVSRLNDGRQRGPDRGLLAAGTSSQTTPPPTSPGLEARERVLRNTGLVKKYYDVMISLKSTYQPRILFFLRENTILCSFNEYKFTFWMR